MNALKLCVTTIGEEMGKGAASKIGEHIGEKFADKSKPVEKVTEYLLKHEGDFLDALKGLPSDAIAAAREFFRRLHTSDTQ